MNKPLIGINPYYFEWRDSYWNATKEKYYHAVWKAGGLPVTVHYPENSGGVQDIVDVLDGWVIVGGPDLDNKLYGGEHPELLDEDVIHPKREAFDRALFLAVKNAGKPILAICLGMQHINVIYGGSLYEDINAQMENPIYHGEFNGQHSYHEVELNKDSIIYDVIGKEKIEVASTHHQGIRRLGTGLRAVGFSKDGLIEAIEDEQNPEAFIAVQWHPEIMENSEDQKLLFKWLIRNPG